MMDYAKAGRRLRSRWPLIGTLIRRRACRELAEEGSPAAVPLLVGALEDRDERVRGMAEAALRSLSGREAVDALCRLAMEDPQGRAARICLETGKRPSDPEEACLFLFVTRQLDAYFNEDFDFQNLRAAYERAEPRVKESVMAVVRSGDRRCLGFFGRRKPLRECTPAEIQLAVESALRHRDWARLFRAFLQLPLKYSFPLLEHFRKSGWAPEEEDLKLLYRNLLRESEGQALPPPSPPPATSPVFERWLEEGRSGEFARRGEAGLLVRLNNAAPPEGVRIVAALAGKAGSGSAAAQAVEQSPHWLVRLAGYATGLCRIPLDRDAVQDTNYWVGELVRSPAVLELWPEAATPADLETLNAAPREAWTGKLGAARRLLRVLLSWQLTAPELEPVVYEAGEFAPELERAE